MTDHYEVLGVEQNARQEEIQVAFDELLASRRSRRQKTSDLHAAIAIIGDPTMRKAYDLSRFGIATSDRLVHAKAVTIGFAKDAIPDVDVREVAAQAREVLLKVTVLGSGAIAKVADVTGSLSRAIQVAASKQLEKKQ